MKRLLIILSIAALPATAQTLKLNEGQIFASEYSDIEQAAILRLARNISGPTDWARQENRIRQQFARLDPEGDGISKLDQSEDFLIQSAGRRANRLREWLAYDLNGDAVVSEEELRIFAAQPLAPPRNGAIRASTIRIRPTEEQSERVFAALLDSLNLPDANGDGRTTLDEMLARANAEEAAREQSESQPNQFGFLPAVTFTFDLDADGTIAEDEFVAAMEQGFFALDTDGDSGLSLAEVKAMRDVRSAIVRAAGADD